MEHAQVLRILVDPPRGGVVNMATDEAILTAVNAAQAPPTLRFYQWSEPTISLGYFQSVAELAEQDGALARLPVVRRQTGGGAILHDDELTYALVLPLDGSLGTVSIEAMYRLVHDSFIEALRGWSVPAAYRGGDRNDSERHGPFFCFARAHRLDLVVGPDKLLGSAQRRIRGAALQHGSLILRRHFPQQAGAELTRLAPQPLDIGTLTEQVGQALAARLRLAPTPGELSDDERDRQIALQGKYADIQWHNQR